MRIMVSADFDLPEGLSEDDLQVLDSIARTLARSLVRSGYEVKSWGVEKVEPELFTFDEKLAKLKQMNGAA